MAGDRRNGVLPAKGLVRRVLPGLFLAVGLLLGACGGTESVAERRARPVRTPDVDDAGAWFGAWVSRRADGSRSGQEAARESLEKGLGTKLAVRHYFYPWHQTPDLTRERRDVDEGLVPMVSWNDGDLRSVASGAEDARIREVVRDLAAIPGRVLLRYGWEMDRDGASGTGSIGTPQDYVAAWKQLRRQLQEAGADNVEMVWCPTSWGFQRNSERDPRRWYPGDDEVDWICADGYNLSRDGKGWRTFDEVFGPFLRWAERRGKPIVLGELAAPGDPNDPDRQAEWIRDMGRAVKCEHPSIRAVVWFDTDRPKRGPVYDWRLERTEETLQAAGDVAADRHFGGPEDTISCD